MHGDEGQLKAAGEEAEHQQHIGAMAERFRQRRLERLLVRGRHIRRCRGRGRERERQRHDQQHQTGEYHQRRLPAEIVDQRHAERREQELAERSGRSAGAERDAAPLRRQQLAECGQHQIERAAGQAEADQDAGAEIERQRRRRVAHHQAGRRHKAARRRTSRARRRSGRRSRRRTAGRAPTTGFERRARGRRRRGPRQIRGSSAE